MQIILTYLKKYNDFINIVLVRKKYENVFGLIQMNPIQITPKTKKLFKYNQTQQTFSPFDMQLNTQKSLFNYPKLALVREIGDNAFEMCKKNLITFPIIEIVQNAFSKCLNITENVPPPHLTHFGNGAFYGCIDLKKYFCRICLSIFHGRVSMGVFSNVNFVTNATLIGHDAFRKCAFKKFSI
ncbi:hypothetical protein EIN_208160, partial [Entamoeba invadens IP1]